MQAEVIAIGDELTSGQRVDTNSAWISRQLGDLGIRTLFHTTVADHIELMATAFRTAVDRADIVVITGGLGPTADDVTRDAMAAAVGGQLVRDEDSLAQIKSRFQMRGREMSPQNVRQAMFPAGSRPIPNPHGTAPGIDMSVTRDGGSSSRFFALPGVPAEMKEMWHESVLPALMARGGQRQVIHHFCLKCFGAGESDLERMLPNLMERGRDPSVGITVSRATITLRVSTAGKSREECRTRMQPTIDIIRDRLGDLVYGEEDDRLEDAVARLLAREHRALLTQEWATGGLLAKWLHRACGGMTTRKEAGTPVYLGGIVMRPGDEAIVEHADQPGGVTTITNTAIGAHVSPFALGSILTQQSLQAAIEHTVSNSPANLGLAIGPIWHGGHGNQPLVGLMLVDGKHVHEKTVTYTGHPDILVDRLAKQALNMLRRYLL